MKLFNKICVPAALTLAMAAAVSCSDNDDENAGWTELIKVATYNIQYDKGFGVPEHTVVQHSETVFPVEYRVIVDTLLLRLAGYARAYPPVFRKP